MRKRNSQFPSSPNKLCEKHEKRILVFPIYYLSEFSAYSDRCRKRLFLQTSYDWCIPKNESRCVHTTDIPPRLNQKLREPVHGSAGSPPLGWGSFTCAIAQVCVRAKRILPAHAGVAESSVVAGRRSSTDRAEHGHLRARGLEVGNDRLPHVDLAELRLADQVRLRARVPGLTASICYIMSF